MTKKHFTEVSKTLITRIASLYGALIASWALFGHFVRLPPVTTTINVVLFAISTLVMLAVETHTLWWRRRAHKFLGLRGKNGILCVLQTIHIREGTITLDDGRRVFSGYKVTYKGQEIEKPVKQELPVYAHRILEAFYAAFNEYPYLKGVKTEFEIDEIVMASDRPTPAVVKEKVVFAFGSSSLNRLTDYLLDQYPFKHQPEFYRFVKGRAATARDSGFVLKANGTLDPTFTAILPEVLTDDTHDYAVLLKHTREDTTYFVCAGLNVTASEASVLYLFKEWKLIRKLACYRDFYILLQVDSDSKHAVERLRAVRERGKKQEYSFSTPLPHLGVEIDKS